MTRDRCHLSPELAVSAAENGRSASALTSSKLQSDPRAGFHVDSFNNKLASTVLRSGRHGDCDDGSVDLSITCDIIFSNRCETLGL